MRNLKRALSLALAAAMLISLMVVGASAASYGDADSIDNTDAVEFLTSLGVVGGDQNGNYNPDATLTRAEFCVMIANALTGGSFDRTLFEGTATPFTDVANHWGEAYIAYCYSVGVIAGTSATTFSPDNTLTAAQASAILLSALGYNQNGEFAQNGQFELNVTRWAQNAGLYDELSVSATAGITRDQTAKLIYNAMNIATPVNYSSLAQSYYTVGTSAVGGQVLRGDGNVTANDYKYTLAATVFSLIRDKGYVVGADYIEATGKYQYNIDAYEDDNFDGASDYVVSTTQDLNDSIGLYVEVLYKTETDNTRTAYGLNSLGNEVTATVGELTKNDDGNNKVTLAGTEYTLNSDTEAGTRVYALVNNTVAATAPYNMSSASVSSLDEASQLTLVDTNKDGKYDRAVVVPATVAQVTYVGTRSITAGAAYTFEDNNIASGIAKDDFVKIIAAANTVDGKAVITEIETTEGAISAMRGTEVQVNGVWYKQAAGNGDTPQVGNTVALSIVGGYYYNVKTIDGKSLNNVLMVLDAGAYSEGLAKGAQAKVMYAATGEVATVQISKVGDVDVIDGSVGTTTASYTTNGYLLEGGMYTYSERNGALELTQLTDNVIGSTTFQNGGGNFVANETRPTIGGSKVIADDAVVMVYNSTGDKTAYITGAELKTWNSAWGTAAQILYSKVNGIDTASVIALYGTTNIPGTSGSTGYGYVTADAYYIEEDNTGYAVMTIWTEDGEITVRAEGYGAGNTAPTAATVASQTVFDKGAFVTYEKLSNGNISYVNSIGNNFGAAALTGMYVDRNGDTALTLDYDALASTPAGNRNLTDDTVVIYVDTDKKTGAEGGELTLAQESAISGAYVKNVMAAYDSTDVLVIFVDVNNNLASNAGLSEFSAQANVTAFDADKGELTITAATAAATVASETVSAFGALAAQLNDTNNDGNSDSGETVTVVAKDGTVVTYTIA